MKLTISDLSIVSFQTIEEEPLLPLSTTDLKCDLTTITRIKETEGHDPTCMYGHTCNYDVNHTC